MFQYISELYVWKNCHMFKACSRSNSYVQDVKAVITKLETGGYNSDQTTPEEHDYIDTGWYPLITIGEGILLLSC